jgi:hypothetical protein
MLRIDGGRPSKSVDRESLMVAWVAADAAMTIFLFAALFVGNPQHTISGSAPAARSLLAPSGAD